VGSDGTCTEVSDRVVVQAITKKTVRSMLRLSWRNVSGISKSVSAGNNMLKEGKSKRPQGILEANERVYFTDSTDRHRRRENREQEEVHVYVIDSVNSGGSVQLESILPAAQVPGARDSSQGSELVTAM